MKIVVLATLVICARAAVAKDACTLLSKEEMSAFIGIEVAQTTANGAATKSGLTSCIYTAESVPEIPRALVILGESPEMRAMMTQGCRGRQQLNELGDRACIQSVQNVTTLAAAKGSSVLVIVLFSRSGNQEVLDPKLAARRVSETVLSRLP